MENLKPVDPNIIKSIDIRRDSEITPLPQLSAESPVRRMSRRALRRMRQENGRSPYLGQH